MATHRAPVQQTNDPRIAHLAHPRYLFKGLREKRAPSGPEGVPSSATGPQPVLDATPKVDYTPLQTYADLRVRL